MEYFSDDTFLEKNQYLWQKNFWEELLKWFNEQIVNNVDESNERCFIKMKIEFEDAYRKLQEDIKELPLVMNCRVKGDNNSNFGGKQCAKFVNLIRKSAEKYIKNSTYSKEKGVKNFITKIRDKARQNEQYAWEFERKTKQDYSTLGVDNSLKIFQESGYNIC